jgi:predicted MPP superfamily phosphohydrolase
MWTRRQFLRTSGAAIGAMAGLGGYAWAVEPHWVEVVRRELPLVGLPDVLRGSRLVQLSDLHVGHRVSEDYLAGALRRAASLDPDIVVLTGDFIAYVVHAVGRRCGRGRRPTRRVTGVPGIRETRVGLLP